MYIEIGITFIVVMVVWALARSRKFRLPRIGTALLTAAAVAALFMLVVFSPGTTLGGPDDGISSPWREVLLFVVMLAGMAARFLTRAIENRRERIAAARAAGKPGNIKIEFDMWEFVYPMITSVMTYGLLMQQVPDGKLTLMILVLAFQNGFFWQTLIGQIESRVTAN